MKTKQKLNNKLLLLLSTLLLLVVSLLSIPLSSVRADNEPPQVVITSRVASVYIPQNRRASRHNTNDTSPGFYLNAAYRVRFGAPLSRLGVGASTLDDLTGSTIGIHLLRFEGHVTTLSQMQWQLEQGLVESVRSMTFAAQQHQSFPLRITSPYPVSFNSTYVMAINGSTIWRNTSFDISRIYPEVFHIWVFEYEEDEVYIPVLPPPPPEEPDECDDDCDCDECYVYSDDTDNTPNSTTPPSGEDTSGNAVIRMIARMFGASYDNTRDTLIVIGIITLLIIFAPIIISLVKGIMSTTKS